MASIDRWISITPGCLNIDGNLSRSGAEGKEFLAQLYRSHIKDYPKFFKMDPLCKLGFVASELLLGGKDISGDKHSLILFNKSGSLATRMIVFYDEGNEVIASVPTFFFSRQGATAEPVAKEIAAALGLSFIPSLEPWEYDSKLRREHEKEVAQKEKETRKRKFQALKNKLLRRPNTETSAPSPLEEMDLNLFEDSSDGINYDALDDEK
jgi:hypothetical protein